MLCAKLAESIASYNIDEEINVILSDPHGGTSLARATKCARYFDKVIMSCGRRICGTKSYHRSHTRPGYGKQLSELRVELSKIPLTEQRKRNKLRHKIRRGLEVAKRASLDKHIRKCEGDMNRRDPLAIWRLIDKITMTSGGTRIPYYNNDGVYQFGQFEIRDGFGSDAYTLFRKPDRDNNGVMGNWGKQRPVCVGEKYVPGHVQMNIDFSAHKVARLRHNIKNGKAVGHFDRVPGELIKYGAPKGVSSIDRALSQLWEYIHDNSACPIYWVESTFTMLYKQDGCQGIYGNYRSISGSSIPGKLYEKHIADEMSAYACKNVNPIFNEHQGGFWVGRGCEMLQLAALGTAGLVMSGYETLLPLRKTTKLLHKPPKYDWNNFSGLNAPRPSLEFKCTGELPRGLKPHAYLFFLDMRKAFDTTSHDILFSELQRFGMSMDTILALADIYSKISMRVKTNGNLSQQFEPEIGFPADQRLLLTGMALMMVAVWTTCAEPACVIASTVMGLQYLSLPTTRW